MARPRQPTNVLDLKGSFKTHPERAAARQDEPVAVGDVGGPPDHLDDLSKAAWVELVKYAHKGVLCEADRPFMEYAAKVWSAIRNSPDLDPKMGMRFESVIGRLGMSPADRSRVSVIKPKADNPADEFARQA